MGDRKARLAALAAKAGRTKQKQANEDERNITNETANDSQEKKAITFRNYAPRDASMDNDKSTNCDDDNQVDGDESAAKKRRLGDTSSGPKTTSLAEALAEAQNDIVKGPGASEEAEGSLGNPGSQGSQETKQAKEAKEA
jgi:hypothetical protein